MDPTIARLRYLNDAAHVLTLSSPSIAATFQARYDHVANENDIDAPNTRAREICSSCGYNLLPTADYTASCQDKRRTMQNKRARRDKTKGTTRTKDKIIVLECSACLAKTDIKLQAAKRSRSSSLSLSLGGRIAHQTVITASSAMDTISSPSRAASTTQGLPTQNNRAKARRAKNRNSLHAMLAKSKEQAQLDKGFGFGFGLMDLMKST